MIVSIMIVFLHQLNTDYGLQHLRLSKPAEHDR